MRSPAYSPVFEVFFEFVAPFLQFGDLGSQTDVAGDAEHNVDELSRHLDGRGSLLAKLEEGLGQVGRPGQGEDAVEEVVNKHEGAGPPDAGTEFVRFLLIKETLPAVDENRAGGQRVRVVDLFDDVQHQARLVHYSSVGPDTRVDQSDDMRIATAGR